MISRAVVWQRWLCHIVTSFAVATIEINSCIETRALFFHYHCLLNCFQIDSCNGSIVVNNFHIALVNNQLNVLINICCKQLL